MDVAHPILGLVLSPERVKERRFERFLIPPFHGAWECVQSAERDEMELVWVRLIPLSNEMSMCIIKSSTSDHIPSLPR